MIRILEAMEEIGLTFDSAELKTKVILARGDSPIKMGGGVLVVPIRC